MTKPTNLIITVIIAAAVAWGVVHFDRGNQPGTAAKESVYDRVVKTGTIRCGYTPYSVGLRRDQSGKIEGMYKDLMDEIANLLSLKIEWVEEVGWGEQIAGLDSGRYDLVCSPANMTGPRTRGADFSPPLYYTPVYAWVKEGDNRFGTNDAANLKRANSADITIATIDGEQAEAQAKQYFPNAKIFSAPQSSPFSVMFINVATGKADITIATPVIIKEFVEKNPDMKFIPINPHDPLILAVDMIQIKSGEFQFKSMISNAITTLIANGALDRIISKWEPYPDSFIHPPRVK
jgi:ABC-type amino acid transport substrate-binding protein